MQVVGRVVRGQGILFSVEPELSFRDPIAITPNDRAEIGIRLMDIVMDIVIAQHHIRRRAVLIRNDKADDPGAVIGDSGADLLGDSLRYTGR